MVGKGLERGIGGKVIVKTCSGFYFVSAEALHFL